MLPVIVIILWVRGSVQIYSFSPKKFIEDISGTLFLGSVDFVVLVPTHGPYFLMQKREKGVKE